MRPLPLLLSILILLLLSTFEANAQTDVDMSNEKKYLSISYGYLGSFQQDVGTSGTFKIGWISKSGLGGIIGLGSIEQSRPSTPGNFATMSNVSIIGGLQFNKVQVSPNSPLGAGLEIDGILTARTATGDEIWEGYYSKGPGLFLGIELTGHLIIYEIFSVNIGFYSAGLYKEDTLEEDQASIASRLLIGAGINIPLSKKSVN